MVHRISKSNDVDMIIAFEEGRLSDEDTVRLFQHLVDTGDAWRLQGSYGRQAWDMLEAGVIHAPKKKTRQNTYDYYGNKIRFPEVK